MKSLQDKIAIVDLHTCIQGEGKYSGIPHILIRMSGCPLRCQFKDAFCDTPFASWNPEKGKYTNLDIVTLYANNPHITHTMITGGEPFANKILLDHLISLGKSFDQYITIETAGIVGFETKADFISISPKLSNSNPVVGTKKTWIDEEVTENDLKKHLTSKANITYNIEKLIKSHPDYQFKFVVDTEIDIADINFFLNNLSIRYTFAPNRKVYLMPEGTKEEHLAQKRQWLMEQCIKVGYNYTDRLHILAYGDKRGV